MQSNPELENALTRVAQDLVTTARLTGVPYDIERIHEVLDAFVEDLDAKPIAFATTTRPAAQRGLIARLTAFDRPGDPYARAVDRGLLDRGDRYVDRLIPELADRFDVLGWGVDAEVSWGVERIRLFFADGHPLDEAHELDALPPSVSEHADFCARHGLTHFAAATADHRAESASLSFVIPEDRSLAPEELASMLSELGLGVPSSSLVAYAARGRVVDLTFRWSSPRVERVSLQVAAEDRWQLPESPLLERLARDVPIRAPRRAFVVTPTFTRTDSPIELGIDYGGTLVAHLARHVAVRPHPPRRRKQSTRRLKALTERHVAVPIDRKRA
jgi:hypothetical protein